ncbi:hypothetical protein RJ639_000081 [Escallonia herrerae]|uniref:Pentatricopeptide repeat-containing protein n=1 Tax=Escallonia herrerae TaxID=1293975 RepID=A0AA89BIJ5_9ASTE|nr:hypothetical protein RJ639_000081 [Escallonia herrerae]
MDLSTDKYCLASVVSACASISSLELGEQIHARATIIGLEFDQIVSTSLVDFYCKCGFVEDGWKLFDEMVKSDEVSWNTMLMGYATNGYGSEALSLFSEMIRVGVVPTEITFTGVLSACDHCGLVEEGQKWFYAMKHDYSIAPGIEHYSYMVDLLARAGCLEAGTVSAKVNIDSCLIETQVDTFGAFFVTAMASEGDPYGQTRGWVGCGSALWSKAPCYVSIQ